MLPDWLQEAIKDQQRQRKEKLAEEEAKQYIALDRKTLRDLERSNFFSCK